MTDRDIHWIDELGDQFAQLGRKIEAGSRAARAPRLRRRTAVLAAASALLLGGAATAAVSGVFDGEPDGLVAAGDKAVVAEGRTDRGTPWQLMTAREGDSFCLALRVRPADAPGPATHANCGGMTPGTLAAGLGGGGPGEALLFGTTPQKVSRIVVSGGDASASRPVVDDAVGLPGKFFVIEVAPGPHGDLAVSARDDQGEPVGRAQAVQTLLRESSPVG